MKSNLDKVMEEQAFSEDSDDEGPRLGCPKKGKRSLF
jgi:hypothetical protein